MRSLDDAPYIDVFSPAFRADSSADIDAARAHGAVARTAIGVLVVRREEVQALLADPRLESSLLPFARMQGLVEGPMYDGFARSLLAVDGEDHTRLRKLVSHAFTPRSVERLRPFMRALAGELIDGFAGAGRCEFMEDFAEHYPVRTICELLGVPAADHDAFARWASSLTWAFSLELAAHLDELHRTYEEFSLYVDALVAERRHAPRDDLVSALVLAEDGGDRLSPLELRSMVLSLLFAGTDATRNQLGIAMLLFAEHPDAWALLRARPALVSRAVDEVLRFKGTVSVAPRFAREDLEIDGYAVPAGTIVTLSTAAANHDPAAVRAPGRFDITVEREPPLTFGGGPHYCLGANLARAEMGEALAILARRLPRLRLAGEVVWRPRTAIIGPASLPLAFG